MTLFIFESSAYKYISELGSSAAQSSGRSFMYITVCAVAQLVITATSVSYGKNGNFDPL